MMQETIKSLLNTDEKLFKTPVDDEDTIEPSITEIQEKYNHLHERYVSLKTSAQSLKEQIYAEKEKMCEELKATIEVQTHIKCKRRHESSHRLNIFSEEDYKKRMEVFKDFVFFRYATENLEDILRRRNYQTWLADVENKCSLELLKIKESMTILKPLQDIASTWGKHRDNMDSKKSNVVVLGNNLDTESVSVVNVDQND